MFTGTVEARSHEGGLLVHFEGSSPALNAIMVKADDGTYIGKVDGVIGSTNHPLAHIAHIDRSLDMDALIGVSVSVRAKKKREESRAERSSRDRGNDRRQGGREQRGFRNDRRDDRRQGGREQRGFRNDRRGAQQQGANDWTCSSCGNVNFAFRTECNRCGAPRNGNSEGHQQGQRRGGYRNDRGGQRQQQGGYRNDRGGRQQGGYRNDRGDRGGGRRSSNGGQRGGGTFNDNDWTCSSCNNVNFSFRTECNRCGAPRPGGGGGGGGRRDDRGHRSNGYQQRGNNRGRGRDGGQQRGRPPQGRGGSRPQHRRSSDVQPRRARGKRSGHAHNQPPRDFRTPPKKFERKDD
ncbi:MAG: hypothetical protein CMB74_02745 [Euryarchaeota archaeon]|nr:hypothetical protein [Euryarchaeota archaeon]